jgi:hypothetical protein
VLLRQRKSEPTLDGPARLTVPEEPDDFVGMGFVCVKPDRTTFLSCTYKLGSFVAIRLSLLKCQSFLDSFACARFNIVPDDLIRSHCAYP